jgi:hypothetical protein
MAAVAFAELVAMAEVHGPSGQVQGGAVAHDPCSAGLGDGGAEEEIAVAVQEKDLEAGIGGVADVLQDGLVFGLVLVAAADPVVKQIAEDVEAGDRLFDGPDEGSKMFGSVLVAGCDVQVGNECEGIGHQATSLLSGGCETNG